MKASLYFSVLAGLGLTLAGCGQKQAATASAPSTNAASGSPLSAPADYVKGLGNAQKRAVQVVDTASINQAIQMFNVAEGRYPKDLDELVQTKYIGKIPDPPSGMKILYDAKTGQVTVTQQ
jgi:hypothetical protein